MRIAPPPTIFRTRAGCAKRCDIPLHRVSFAGRVPRAGIRPFLARIRRRPHSESGRAVQSGNQVRRLPGLHAPSRAHRGSPRSLCAVAPHGQATAAAEGGRRRQGPELFPAWRRAGRTRKTLFPIGELRKDEVRRRAHAAGLRGVRQAGQHRHLLHRRAALPGIPRAATCAPRPARSKIADGKR